VGFIELLATPSNDAVYGQGQIEQPRLRRLHERNWPIQNHLKNENSDSLFSWIGSCIAIVIRDGCADFGLPLDEPLPMGVTFSFPMEQETLSEAKLMPMGKGFTINSKLDLGSQLRDGYEKARSDDLPPIRIASIANDSIATLVSFIYEFRAEAHQRAVMGLICGTGTNATLPLKLSCLHPKKRPKKVNVLPGQNQNDVKIVVNTEWSIKGTAPPLRAAGLVSSWDEQLSQAVEYPGFQPLEYMISGRYLGELGRIILIDYMSRTLGLSVDTLPAKLLRKFEPHNTTFLSHYHPSDGCSAEEQSLLQLLENEFPLENETKPGSFRWTEEIAHVLYRIAQNIEMRAAGIVAAALIGLLDAADELPMRQPDGQELDQRRELVVGYTGGCITNFQDYLQDCQRFLDDIMLREYGDISRIRVVLSPCHDGGIKGAGIMVAAALASEGLDS